MCLEFSKIDNELIKFIYKKYSKIIQLSVNILLVHQNLMNI